MKLKLKERLVDSWLTTLGGGALLFAGILMFYEGRLSVELLAVLVTASVGLIGWKQDKK